MKNILLTSMVVISIAGFSSYLSASGTPEEREHAKTIIQGYGHPCSSVDMTARKSDGGWHVSCDSFRYRYELNKKGNTWVVARK